MTAVDTWLADAQARADAATDGTLIDSRGMTSVPGGVVPEVLYVTVQVPTDTDVPYRVSLTDTAARTDLPAAVAALRAVLGLADGWDAALPGVADDLRSAIASALGVSEP